MPFVPQHQSGAERGVAEAQVAVVIEQHSVQVGQDDGVTRSRQLVVQVGHLRISKRDQLEVLLFASQALLAGQNERLPL
jgi:hypothetical protein